jgi:hypothetical protein
MRIGWSSQWTSNLPLLLLFLLRSVRSRELMLGVIALFLGSSLLTASSSVKTIAASGSHGSD